MSVADLALQALLTEQARQAAEPTWSDRFAAAVPSVFKTFADASSQIKKDNAEYGTPQRGYAPVITIGAPPADPRRRVMGIPMGSAAPAATMLQPPMAGDMATDLSQIPPELLTQDVQGALGSGQQVFYRPASKNYRPATLGKDEKTLRSGLTSHVVPAGADYGRFFTEPDTGKAMKGATTKRTDDFGGGSVEYSEDLKKLAIEMNGGVDPYPGATRIPFSAANAISKEAQMRNRPTTQLNIKRLQETLKNGDLDTTRADLGMVNQAVAAIDGGRMFVDPALENQYRDMQVKLTDRFQKLKAGGGKEAGPGADAQKKGEIPRVTSQAQYDKLSSGAKYLDPQGVTRTKK